VTLEGVGGLRPDVAGAGAPPSPPATRAAGTGAPSFDEVLRNNRGELQFSKHALKRIEQRGLQLDPDQLRRLNDAVDRAEQKGSKDSLILLDELALVVSVQNHTVVTAVDEGSQKEHVFTNIDSVVIAH
jgi:flagellar operon protein